MPFITAPKGTPMPDVAALAGMPVEAPEVALSGLMGAAREGVGDIFGPLSKAIQGLRSTAPEGGEQLSHLGPAMKQAKMAVEGVQPYNSAAGYGSKVFRQPKPGGVLDQVLQRGAELSGAGQDVPPGTQRLMNHFAGLIR